VTAKVPRLLRIRGEELPVQSWVDVAVATMESIAKMGEEEFARVVGEMPKFANRDATAFRRSSRLKKLSNDAYVETNLSATTIHRLCLQPVQISGLDREDWSVEYTAGSDDEDDQTAETSSQIKPLQLEFWTEIRAALDATGSFTSLPPPRPRAYFDIPSGRGGFWLSLSANTVDRKMRVKLVIAADKADSALPVLLVQCDAVEQELSALPTNLPRSSVSLRPVLRTPSASGSSRWPSPTWALGRTSPSSRANLSTARPSRAQRPPARAVRSSGGWHRSAIRTPAYSKPRTPRELGRWPCAGAMPDRPSGGPRESYREAEEVSRPQASLHHGGARPVHRHQPVPGGAPPQDAPGLRLPDR
jgi:hypothetical protein